MGENYDRLRVLEKSYFVAKSVEEKLGWDQEVTMPEGSAAVKGEHASLVSEHAHNLIISDDMGTAIERAKAEDLTPDQRADLLELERIRDRETKIPGDLVTAIARAEAETNGAWKAAKRESNYGLFVAPLENMIALQRARALAIDPNRDPYEVLLDINEQGAKVEALRTMFAALRAGIVPILNKITNSGVSPDMGFQKFRYDLGLQDSLCRQLAERMGFNFTYGRLDSRADAAFHPMTCEMTPYDVRITTRLFENDPLPGTTGIIHEAGHGIYSQGLPKEFIFSAGGQPRSLGIHESQSRIWENHVGRSRAFWEGYFPKLQRVFPVQLAWYDADTFYHAANSVKSDFIRVEADEITYNLHVLLRFEMEDAFMNGKVGVKDLPEMWNANMKTYLGITPQNDAQGVLQDIHWSIGLFGYFPSYTFGTVLAAQLFEAAMADIPNLNAKIAKGQFGDLKTWLGEKVHRHGSLRGTDEIIIGATGRPLDTDAYFRHLETKFSELYHL